MPLQIAQHVAAARRLSQDRIFVSNDGALATIAVADGAGGVSGGGEAADAVVDHVAGMAPCLEASRWRHTLCAIDRAIENAPGAGETTAVGLTVQLCRVHRQHIVGASAGDSRARPIAFEANWSNGTLVCATDGLWNYTQLRSIRDICVHTAHVAEIVSHLVALVLLPSGRLRDDVAIIAMRADRDCPDRGRLVESAT